MSCLERLTTIYCGETSTILVNRGSFSPNVMELKTDEQLATAVIETFEKVEVLTWLVRGCGALELVEHVAVRDLKLALQTWSVYWN